MLVLREEEEEEPVTSRHHSAVCLFVCLCYDEERLDHGYSCSRMDVIAVTGASGLTGRFVVDRLLKSGRYKEIRLIDRIPSARIGQM
ncbi:hypothetical protein RB195_020322 [Necator americanus]|uniref:3-beta hydroxysteroid dehydrogenase/isomerase domain-containing protein n=1 Tax=Necator americanus TaxID=51031 RepID=A0ABR1CI85_NECAM